MFTRRAFLTSGAGSLIPACRRRKASGFTGLAFVANREGKAVAVVDLSAFAVTRHLSLAGSPSAVLSHAARPAVYALTPASGVVHEIDSSKLTLTRSVRLDAGPDRARFSQDGSALWILCPERKHLMQLRLDSLRPGTRASLPSTPADFDIGMEGTVSEGLAAVTLGESGDLALVRLATGRTEHVLHLGGRLGRIRFRKDGKVLIIASLEDRQLVIFDVTRGKVAVRLPLPVRPERFTMKPDGGQLFVTGEGMDAVVIVYPYLTEVAGAMLAGRSPGFVAVSTQPDYLFVANPLSGDVTIVNVGTQKVMAVAPVGKEPCFIAITPDSEFALVLNRQSGDMAVLHVGTISARRTRSAPVLTMIPVGSEPVSAVVRWV